VTKYNALKYHCIRCNKSWGSGDDTESHGICPECFAYWAKKKQKSKGLKECYGEFEQSDDVNCGECSKGNKCKEYYGIKQDLSG
jgi:hypothetical protein